MQWTPRFTKLQPGRRVTRALHRDWVRGAAWRIQPTDDAQPVISKTRNIQRLRKERVLVVGARNLRTNADCYLMPKQSGMKVT